MQRSIVSEIVVLPLGDAQARGLLEALPPDTLKGVRDRAILATLLYHGIRREELCLMRVRDIESREGVKHFRIKGKGDKTRYVPVHPMAQRLIEEYLAIAKHGGGQDGAARDRSVLDGPLFRPVKNNPTGTLDKHLEPRLRLPEHRQQVRPDNGRQRRSERAVCAFAAGDGGDQRALA
jgi:integrase/recombinase XerD